MVSSYNHPSDTGQYGAIKLDIIGVFRRAGMDQGCVILSSSLNICLSHGFFSSQIRDRKFDDFGK